MSLRSSCTICTDYFSTEKDISATFCGHLFHAECLNRWFKTCGTQQSCPQCRSRIKHKQVVTKIYLNIREDDVTDLDPCLLKNKLDELEVKLVKVKNKKKEIESTCRVLNEDKENLKSKIKYQKQELIDTKNILSLLKTDIDVMKSDAADGRQARNEMIQMRERIKVMERIEVILDGQKSEVNEMLSQYTHESSSNEPAKRLATLCVSLKQEYENLKNSKKKIDVENMKLRKEVYKKNHLILSQKSKIETLEENVLDLQDTENSLTQQNESLNKKLKALQQAIASPSDTKSSAMSRLIAESPAPEFLTPYSKPVKRVNISDDSVKIKKPRLSISFDENDDVIDLDEESENNLSIDSPSTSKFQKHFNQVKISRTGLTKPYSKLPRKTPLLNKNPAKPSSNWSYGSEETTIRRPLQPSPRNKPFTKGPIKFSSCNNKLRDPNVNNRFARLKRGGPK